MRRVSINFRLQFQAETYGICKLDLVAFTNQLFSDVLDTLNDILGKSKGENCRVDSLSTTKLLVSEWQEII